MVKARISSVDLSWMILEQLREYGNCPRGLSLAVVPDRRDGWRAVVAIRQKSGADRLAKRLADVQKKLRTIYALEKD